MDPIIVTPTPFTPEEAVSWLAPPSPDQPPLFAVLLKPEEIKGQVGNSLIQILGPRWVRLGGGIEYIVRGGIPRGAIVDVGVAPDTKWPLLVI